MSQAKITIALTDGITFQLALPADDHRLPIDTASAIRATLDTILGEGTTKILSCEATRTAYGRPRMYKSRMAHDRFPAILVVFHIEAGGSNVTAH